MQVGSLNPTLDLGAGESDLLALEPHLRATKHLPCKEKAHNTNPVGKEAHRGKKRSGRECSRNGKHS